MDHELRSRPYMMAARPVSQPITKQAIRETEVRIRPHIRSTPILMVRGADFGIRCREIALKLELFQHTGSFKARGAFTNLLTRAVPKAGVVAASGGNHGSAVAFAAKTLGHKAKIFVPKVASPAKIAKIRSAGAELEITGDSYADALAASEIYVRESGALAVHAFDQHETLLGQGTLGLELEQQMPNVESVLVAVGGGGLIGGIASWFAESIEAKKVRIIGVEPEKAPTLARALEAGRPVDAPGGGIAADSLAARQVGALMFPIAQRCVSRVALVSDTAIRRAQEALWNTVRIAAEPGGAAAFAALLSGQYVPREDERIAVIVCGGNTTAVDFTR